MNVNPKRKDTTQGDNTPKRVKKECSYGEKCYRRNPAHFREFSHPHLESIIDASAGSDYVIPDHLSIQKHMIIEQIEVIIEKKLYESKKDSQNNGGSPSSTNTNSEASSSKVKLNNDTESGSNKVAIDKTQNSNDSLKEPKRDSSTPSDERVRETDSDSSVRTQKEQTMDGRNSTASESSSKEKGDTYVPIVPPSRRAEQYLKVVRPGGRMLAKLDASSPYHIFYTTISDCKETHSQPFSITFLEILDRSLGELKCSLQINFMVEPGWLLAQYYFAGYSQKKLTILYEDDCGQDLKNIHKKKPHVDAHLVQMGTPFGKHHTKMMVLCYEDGSLRVVVSTANLYQDDWENRTQGLWISPACHELPAESMPHAGDSPTLFKKSLLRYLHQYHSPAVSFYVDRVKRCDFSHINVFLVASAPGGHFDMDWGLTRIGALLRQHCAIAPEENRLWPLVAQASSLGSYGKEAKLWLTGDFLQYFTKIKNQSQMLSQPPELKLIYPSTANVLQSHDGPLGGGCLPYSAAAHSRQPWLTHFLYQWKATHTSRNRAMPHIKSYARINKEGNKAAFFLLTSANVSKAAWGQINKGNGALRIMSYEAGVLFLPKFVLNEDFFPLTSGAKNRLVIPYDLPPTKYTSDMSPWVLDYLGGR